MNDRPQDIDEYRIWLRRQHDVKLARAKTHYDTVSVNLRDAATDTFFWEQLQELTINAPDEYSLKTGYELFPRSPDLELDVKRYDSFFEKTYRKNVLQNNNWPEAPDIGWYLPPDWIEQINDVIRTMFVVKYLDGVDYLLDEIQTIAASLDLDFHHYYVARDEGYYAVHTYTTLPLEVATLDFESEVRDIALEIHITTQLQEVIRKLLHEYYEQDRLQGDRGDKPWQWDYRDERFFANHLGHILNYVEGMILEVRD